jgi:hypothetical protein
VHRPAYGLTKPVTTSNVPRLQFQEYAEIARDVRAADVWRARLGHVFGPPGWQPRPRVPPDPWLRAPAGRTGARRRLAAMIECAAPRTARAGGEPEESWST